MQENQQVIIQINYPPVIGYDELAQLLGKTAATLQADACRAPERLPPPCVPPGTRSPRWLLVDVLNWLAEFRAQPQPVSPAPQDRPRRRGRPTKAEEIARRRAEGGEV